EAAGLLARREFLECGEELSDNFLRRNEEVRMVEEPVVVGVRRDVRPLVWIGPQIVELRNPQGNERLSPEPERSLGALFFKNDLPIVVTQSHKFGIVIEVEEILARTLLRFAGEERQQVVAVKMHLESR